MATEVKFKKKSKVEIDSLPVEDGSIIFSTDSPDIFIDDESERKAYKIDATQELKNEINEIISTLPEDYTQIVDNVDFLSMNVNDLYDIMIEIEKMNNGGYINTSGSVSEFEGSSYSELISVIPNSIIRCRNIFVRGSRCICAFDGSGSFLSVLLTNSEETEAIISVDENTHYIRITGKDGSVPILNYIKKIDNTFDDVKTMISEYSGFGYIKKSISGVNNGYYIRSYSDADSVEIGENWTEHLLVSSESACLTEALDVSEYIGNTAVIMIPNYDIKKSSRAFGLCNSNNIVSYVSNFQNPSAEHNGFYYYEFPITNTHLFASWRTVNGSSAEMIKILIKIDNLKSRIEEFSDGTYYVSESGDDYNVGNSGNPLATVNVALEKGAKKVCIYGGIYNQTIDLTKCKFGEIILEKCEPDKEVTFCDPNRIVLTSGTLYSGKVYKSDLSASIDSGDLWIYQEGVNDATTEILDSERYPLQRGYEYRCHDTKISKAESTNLSDAISEMQSSDKFLWFLDSGVLYYTSPVAISEENPLCIPMANSLFIVNNGIKITAIGISSKYLMFNVNQTVGSRILDCKSTNVYGGGAFTYNSALDCKFLRCEAARCVSGSNGDGFNGHSNNTGDIYSKQTTCTLIDCWSHDNKDDGYSDHERSETTIIGGLYEYNGKAGVTPSYGSHCTCYNVYSRNNFSGFYYTGDVEPEEGGTAGQMSCFNCLSENNNVGGKQSGYCVDGKGNSLTLVNCKSVGNGIGYNCISSLNTMTLVDCGTVNDDTIKSGNGEFVIKNTNKI